MTSSPLRVWAPRAAAVAVQAAPPGDAPVAHPMAQHEGGWWEWTPPSDGPFDYAFRLEGGPPRPDPRSPWQPHGVHGPSRTFDAGAHEWRDAGWPGTRGGAGVLGGVVYELHVGTFTDAGSLDAAVEHLTHLTDLGIDLVEVMPVAAFGGTHGWGYDGVQPYAVQQTYGGPAAFQRFVDACHGVGLGVCLDVVYNHLGPTGNYLAEFGPYFNAAHDTPWGPSVNLDGPGSHEVRRWVIDNALRWMRDFHVDALRLDAVHALHDDGSPRHVLAELSDEVASLATQLRRPLDLIAESDLNDPVLVAPTSRGGLGMTAQWDDDVHHALHVALTGETSGYYRDFAGGTEAWPDGGPLSVLAKTLTEVFLHDGRTSSFRGRHWGHPVDRATVSGHRFVASLQTHDQVGNRALGDRISSLTTPGQQAIGAALYLLSPYTAMVFMGEEWRASTPFRYFTSFDEEWLVDAVRTGRRREFAAHGWAVSEVPDPQDPATRTACVLRWDEVPAVGHAQMLAFYRRLIELRRSEPDIASGELTALDVRCDEAARWLVMTRGSVAVVANLAPEPRAVPVPAGVADVLLSWGDLRTEVGGIRLGGHSVAVVRTP
ncbi:MAG: malto-oligosyltrehalose trehalohydrolase [Intrasporangium sp.]|uniref:malto-oligosyltrehalose trehalohydrolase n=1 Tax=Intrasporangium sp. TaxID=1925024 RepID=UPI002649E897|nr:malto-oligosyltrehalose trehalohydrolase [Intrasporangium sp.]MDN5795280.1 malto-oligosyltrehalose trehalohydrolase [Intrasporangium sp.]